MGFPSLVATQKIGTESKSFLTGTQPSDSNSSRADAGSFVSSSSDDEARMWCRDLVDVGKKALAVDSMYKPTKTGVMSCILIVLYQKRLRKVSQFFRECQ